MSRARLLVPLWRSEGLAGILCRARDHLAAGLAARRFTRVGLAAMPDAPVLRVAATAPVPWLGGVPAQLGDRLQDEERQQPTALLYPWREGWRLEVATNGRRLAAVLPVPASCEPSMESSSASAAVWAAGVRAAANAVRARILHFEGAAGLPHAALTDLARERTTVLALHDFALLCPRPNLFDERTATDCGYCADAQTCHACLVAAGHQRADSAWQWRARGAELLAACRAVVYPSEFLRAAHDRFFGTAGAGATQRVIAPGIACSRLLPWRWPWTPRSPVPRIAFTGGGAVHKGGALLSAVVTEWSRRGLPAVHWHVLGGGGIRQLMALRRLTLGPGSRLSIGGYYRHGDLGAQLRARRVELALLLPQVPETFSLTLSECLAAGVPVMATPRGALVERLAAGGGHLLPAGAGAEQVVAALRGWIAGQPLPAEPPPMPTTSAAAAAYLELYVELLREGGATTAAGR